MTEPSVFAAWRRAVAAQVDGPPPYVIYCSRGYLEHLQAERKAYEDAADAFRARLPEILADLTRPIAKRYYWNDGPNTWTDTRK